MGVQKEVKYTVRCDICGYTCNALLGQEFHINHRGCDETIIVKDAITAIRALEYHKQKGKITCNACYFASFGSKHHKRIVEMRKENQVC